MKKKNYTGHLTLQLEPDEAVVVLEKKFWDHLIKWYTIMANECGDPVEKANWVSIVDAVDYWVGNTHVDPKQITNQIVEDEDDEWN